MFDTLGGVTDARMAEIAAHLFWPVLGAPQESTHIPDQLGRGTRPLPPHCVGFDVLVEELVWIELRAVAGQEKQANLPPMAFYPSLGMGTHVHRMFVDDEEELAPRVADQSPQEGHKHRLREATREDHEPQLSPVGERRDHVAPKAFPGSGDDRCMPTPAKACARLVIGAHPRLVAPVDRRALPPGERVNGGILLLQPPAHRLRVPLVGSPDGFLGSKSPVPQIPAHRPDRETNPEAAGDEVPHRLPGPENEGHFQLVRAAVGDEADNRGCLIGLEPGHRRPPPRPRPQCSQTSFPPALVPPIDRLSRHPKDMRSLGLRHPLGNDTHHPPAQRIQSSWRQVSSVLAHHA